MEAFEFAGFGENGGVSRWRGPRAGVIAGRELGRPPGAVKEPDLSHGVVGQLEFGGDRDEFLTLEMTPDDLLADGHGQGTRHGDQP
jgi:hypothetical protein